MSSNSVSAQAADIKPMMQQLALWSTVKSSAITEERLEDSVLAVGLGVIVVDDLVCQQERSVC